MAKRLIQEAAERVNPVTVVHCWESPAGAATKVRLITHLEVYSTLHAHSVDSLPNETGGFLLGHVAHDPVRHSWHVEIDETLPVDPLSQDPVHFSFTWRDVDRVRNHREAHSKALVGWYHTHPDLGIFLSHTDLEKTHRVLFTEPFQVALVYDPVRHRAGYFFWEGPQIIDAAPAAWREFALAVAPEPSGWQAPTPEPDLDGSPKEAGGAHAEGELASEADTVEAAVPAGIAAPLSNVPDAGDALIRDKATDGH